MPLSVPRAIDVPAKRSGSFAAVVCRPVRCASFLRSLLRRGLRPQSILAVFGPDNVDAVLLHHCDPARNIGASFYRPFDFLELMRLPIGKQRKDFGFKTVGAEFT